MNITNVAAVKNAAVNNNEPLGDVKMEVWVVVILAGCFGVAAGWCLGVIDYE